MEKKAAREKGKHHRFKVRLGWLLVALLATSLLLGCIPPPSRLTQMTQGDPGQIDQAETGQIYFKKTEARHIALDSRTSLIFSDNELLVVGKDGSSYQAMEALAKEYGAKIVGYIEVTNDYQWQFSNSASKTELDDLIALLSLNELVEEVTLNLLAEYEPTYVPSQDTEWPADSFDESYPEGNNWGVEAVGAIEAWDLRDEMTPIRVGLIDTGFDAAGQVNQDRAGYSATDLAYTGHEDLDFAATFFNPPRSSDDPVESERDHGTHVAGTFAAGFDNGRGITGLYPHAAGNLYGVSIRGMESSGYLSGQARNFLSSVAYKTAFAELVARNVKVINVSMGYRDEIVFAAQRGNSRAIDLIRSNASILAGFLGRLLRNGYDFVIVVAAGNTSDTAFEETSDLESFPYGWRRSSLESAGRKVRCSPIYSNGLIFTAHPTVSERVIAVGSARVKHQKNGEFSYILSKFSNAGSGLDLVAPGEEIHSCVPGGYDEDQGTSMAAPHVTGIAAMVWSYNLTFTV